MNCWVYLLYLIESSDINDIEHSKIMGKIKIPLLWKSGGIWWFNTRDMFRTKPTSTMKVFCKNS